MRFCEFSEPKQRAKTRSKTGTLLARRLLRRAPAGMRLGLLLGLCRAAAAPETLLRLVVESGLLPWFRSKCGYTEMVVADGALHGWTPVDQPTAALGQVMILEIAPVGMQHKSDDDTSTRPRYSARNTWEFDAGQFERMQAEILAGERSIGHLPLHVHVPPPHIRVSAEVAVAAAPSPPPPIVPSFDARVRWLGCVHGIRDGIRDGILGWRYMYPWRSPWRSP